MRRTSFRLVPLGMVLALGLGCGHKEAAKPAPVTVQPSKQASTPEEAIAFLIEASKAKNRDDYYDQLVAVYRDSRNAKTRLREQSQAFNEALKKKFGPEANTDKSAGYIDLPDWDPNVISLEGAELIEKKPQKDDTYLLRVKVKPKFAAVGKNIGEPAKELEQDSEERFTALKEGGVWKLMPLVKVAAGIGAAIGGNAPAKPSETAYEIPNLKAIADEAVVADKLAAATEQLTKDLEAGKYPTAKEAHEARTKKLQEVLATAGKKQPAK